MRSFPRQVHNFSIFFCLRVHPSSQWRSIFPLPPPGTHYYSIVPRRRPILSEHGMQCSSKQPQKKDERMAFQVLYRFFSSCTLSFDSLALLSIDHMPWSRPFFFNFKLTTTSFRRSKSASEYYDPCQEFADRSIRCMRRNAGDREMCGDYFQWVKTTLSVVVAVLDLFFICIYSDVLLIRVMASFGDAVQLCSIRFLLWIVWYVL